MYRLVAHTGQLNHKGFFKTLMLLSVMASWPIVNAQPGIPQEDPVADAQMLETEVLRLNRELFLLEEDLLYPPETQVRVFLSWDGGVFFDLDSVELKINGQTVASHLYTERQREALQRGGLQQIYQGNLKSGEHEVTAVVTGVDKERKKDLRMMRRAASINAVKTDTSLKLELSIEDDAAMQQPKLSLVQWTDADT